MYYYIFVNKEQQGPYSLEELRTRHITSDTLVWREGMEQWMPAWQVADLRQLFESAQPTPPPMQPESAAPAQPCAPQAQPEQQKPQAKRSGCSKILLGVLVVIALALFTLAATCPSRQDHQEAVKAEVNRLLEKATEGSDNDFFSAFGKMFTTSITSMAVDQMLDVHNYVLWSVGEVHYAGHTKKVSFGILNHVFTFDADDLENAMKGSTSIKESEESSEETAPQTSAGDSFDNQEEADTATSE